MPGIGTRTEGKRGALYVLLVGEAEDHRTEVKAALAALDDPALEITETIPGGGSTNGGPPPDVTMVLFNGGNEEASLNFLQAQAETSPRPVLFALVHERSPVLMRRILRAGADELLFLPLDPGDATRALLKISETRRRAERQAGGVIVSMVSTVGGVGVTSLAGNLALALRYTFNKRVAVVDLDLQLGGMAVFLNLEPERTIMQLCEGDRRLDSIQLESSLTKHPSGIYLLAAPKRIEDSELVSEKTVGAVLELMRQLFDFVVVDCGGYIDENAVAAWERSDHLFYVLDQSIAAARCAWRFVDLFGRLGLSGVEPNFILSRFMPHHPITEEQITHTLGRPIYAKIPREEKVLERMQLRAQDLWTVGSGSPLARAVEDLARRVARWWRSKAAVWFHGSYLLWADAPKGLINMKLVERISTQTAQTAQTPARTSLMNGSPRRQRDTMADGFQQLKLAVHNRLFETLDVSRLESLEQNMASTKVTQAITEILNEEGRLLTDTDRARLVEEIKNELLGLGPLEPLLWDDDVSDILVNGPNQVYVERQG